MLQRAQGARTLRAAARSRRTRPHLKPASAAHRCAPLPPHQVSLEEVRARIHDFAAEREWQQYHTPRNLLLALVGEVRRIAARGQLRSPAPVTNCAARPQRAFKVRSKASRKPHAPAPAQLLLPLVAIDRQLQFGAAACVLLLNYLPVFYSTRNTHTTHTQSGWRAV